MDKRQRYVRELSLKNPLPRLLIFTVAVIAALYWFFGTEKGSSLRATGANPNMAVSYTHLSPKGC